MLLRLRLGHLETPRTRRWTLRVARRTFSDWAARCTKHMSFLSKHAQALTCHRCAVQADRHRCSADAHKHSVSSADCCMSDPPTHAQYGRKRLLVSDASVPSCTRLPGFTKANSVLPSMQLMLYLSHYISAEASSAVLSAIFIPPR